MCCHAATMKVCKGKQTTGLTSRPEIVPNSARDREVGNLSQEW